MGKKSIKQNRVGNGKRNKTFIFASMVILLIIAGSAFYQVQANGQYIIPELNFLPLDKIPVAKRDELLKTEKQIREAREHPQQKPDPKTVTPQVPTFAQGVTFAPEATPAIGIFFSY